MKQLKTESSSVGELFALSKNKQPDDGGNKINWRQVAATVGPIALLLLIFIFVIRADKNNRDDKVMPGPPQPVAVNPTTTEEIAQFPVSGEDPVVQEIISGPDKNSF